MSDFLQLLCAIFRAAVYFVFWGHLQLWEPPSPYTTKQNHEKINTEALVVKVAVASSHLSCWLSKRKYDWTRRNNHSKSHEGCVTWSGYNLDNVSRWSLTERGGWGWKHNLKMTFIRKDNTCSLIKQSHIKSCLFNPCQCPALSFICSFFTSPPTFLLPFASFPRPLWRLIKAARFSST